MRTLRRLASKIDTGAILTGARATVLLTTTGMAAALLAFGHIGWGIAVGVCVVIQGATLIVDLTDDVAE